jgi:hypothetical protein
VSGFVEGGRIAARIGREDPGDRGFVGTLVGEIVGSRIDGTLRVCPAEAQAVRVATFSLGAEAAASDL